MDTTGRWTPSGDSKRLIATLQGELVRLKAANLALLSQRPGLTVVPLGGFAAEVTGVDLSAVRAGTDLWATIKGYFALYPVLVFRDQNTLSPEHQARFTRLFDPASTTVWRDQRTNPWELFKAEHMGGAGTFQLPSNPDVLVLGKGELEDHHGLSATLGGARKAYGKDSGSQVLGGGSIQWHIDGSFYGAHPCRVSAMHCVEAPDGPPHDIAYEDGSGAVLTVPLGSTAFASAYESYERLSAGQRAAVRGATVQYLPHPFKVTKDLGTTLNGLRTTAPEGFDEGPAAAQLEAARAAGDEALRSYPVVWEHPVTKRKAVMPHTRCLVAITLAGGRRLVGDEARLFLEPLMRPAVEPGLVYAHGYRRGDFVLWDNLCLWHSATGGLQDQHRRVMHLMSFDGSQAPREEGSAPY